MTLWEFMACIEGYGRANGWKIEDKVEPMSIERLRALGVDGIE